MTDEMLALARANAAAAGVENVEFLKGYLEDIPLPDATVDVVISNCVINLAADKRLVLAEAARVLQPGGRFAVSDVIADDGHGRRHPLRHGAVDRLHRRRAHRDEFAPGSPTPASSTSRSPRPTASTSTRARRSSARASPSAQAASAGTSSSARTRSNASGTRLK